jgi:hypothetical protein
MRDPTSRNRRTWCDMPNNDTGTPESNRRLTTGLLLSVAATVLLAVLAAPNAAAQSYNWSSFSGPSPTLSAYNPPVYNGCPMWAHTQEDREWAASGNTAPMTSEDHIWRAYNTGFQILEGAGEWAGGVRDARISTAQTGWPSW